MIITGTCRFDVVPVAGGWRVEVTTFCGSSPVGPRLLRGADINPLALKGVYDELYKAELAKSIWEQYRDDNLRQESRKQQIKEHKAKRWN